MARRYAAFLHEGRERGWAWLRDVCYTASLCRNHHEHRLAVIASSIEELASKLEAFASKEARPGLFSAQVDQKRKLVFVFSGQGPQWWAMGRQLLAREPLFRQKVEECDGFFRRWAPWSIVEELNADEQCSRLDETAIAQPAIFSLQVALAALWSSWGIAPEAVVGHSVGEVAAAYVSGALDLETAAWVIYQRGRCMGLAPTTGRMLAAGLPAEEALGLVNANEDGVSVAAINSPSSITLSGDAEPLLAIEKSLNERGVFCRFLKVQYAFHSSHMQAIEGELAQSLSAVDFRPARIPMFSTVTGSSLNGAPLNAAYWWRNVRNTVHFAEAIDALVQDGVTAFLEVGPHPVLTGAVLECAARRSCHPKVLFSLRRGEDESATMLQALIALYTLGYPIDWPALFPLGGRCLRLPAYPWKHRRYWQESDESRRERLETFIHPLLGRRINAANPYWENKLEGRQRSLLADHRVQGSIVFPAAGFVEMALAGGKQLLDGDACTVEEVEIHKALFLPAGGEGTALQFTYHPSDRTFQIFSRANESQGSWNLHCSGQLGPAEAANTKAEEPAQILERCPEEIQAAEIYPRLAELGLQYGPKFQGIHRIWRGEAEVMGRIAPPRQLDDDKYQVPLGLLDSCFQVLLAFVLRAAGNTSAGLYLPARLGRVRLHRKPAPEIWCHARLKKGHRGMLEADLRLLNPDGQIAVEIDSFQCLAVEGARRSAAQNLDDALYEFEWQLQPLSSAAVESAPGHLPDLGALARDLQKSADLSAVDSEKAKLAELEADIDHLCACYVVQALEQLGCPLRAGSRISTESLYSRVSPQYHAVLGRYLTMLEEDRVLKQIESGWIVSHTAADEDPGQLWRAIYRRLPGYLPEAALLRGCGRRLAEILRGEIDPLEILFGGNSFIEQFFSDSVSYRPCYRTVQSVMQAVVKSLPEGRKLRILELGAGTGGLTSHVLPTLDLAREQVDYVFTDVANQFLARAGQRFQQFAGLRYQLLDLEKSPLEQGFAEHSFDLVLAANVLHATADVRRSLAHIKQVLASGGMILVIEIDHPSRWVDLVFAPTKGWWNFTDKDLRANYPLLSGTSWLKVLEEEGFVDCAAVADVGGLRDTRHVVLLARGQQVPQPLTPVVRAPTGANASWLLFADAHGVAQKLANHLAAWGHSCIMAFPGTSYHEIPGGHFQVRAGEKADIARLLDAAVTRSGLLHGIIFLWSAEPAQESEPAPQDLGAAQEKGCHSVLALLQALAERSEFPQLWLVTRGTQAAGRERRVDIRQSALWGLGRVVMNENPRLCCRMVDLALNGAEEETLALAAEVCAGGDEEEIALRGSARYVLRAVRIPAASRRTAFAAAGSPFRLEIGRPGVLDDLSLRPTERRKPGPGEIEVQVEAAALNFRDVMKALGIYPRESPDNFILGDECGGHVVAVGEGVAGFHIGDRVGIALADHCLASHVTCPSFQAAHLPPSLGWEEAMTVPIAFMTAAYGLYHLAKMASGERVLIHSAAGGVGLAAVQMALSAGCEVFATAGNDKKRDFLRGLGAHHVMDSRTLSFAGEVMDLTGGQGVDIVLNSLAGEALTRSIALLRHNGRFIEIGKRDIFGNSRIGLRPFRTNISFHSLDLIVATQHQPDVMRALWERILADIEQGKLHTLPMRLFAMNDAAEAFRYMMQGDHIGKIVLRVTGNETIMRPFPEPGKLRFDGNAAYLITGGLGGFGLATARWMVEHGARHLVLVGRSGASSEAARRTIDELTQKSVRVTVAHADVSSADQVATVLDGIRCSTVPLRGVIHAAMVLDDGVALQLDRGRFQKVVAPKMDGAWHLHLQTRDQPLDFFVCFSSVSSVIGNSGQANYAAANTFLDAFAHYRRAQGLPALTVNWGPLKEVGYVAQHAGLSDSLAHLGMKVLEVQPALSMLGRVMQTERPQLGIIDANWNQWARSLGPVHPPRRFCTLITRTGSDSDQIADGEAVREAILAVSGEERRRLIESFLCKQVAKVLRTSAANLDTSKPLHELGLDSLTAVELVNLIEGGLGLAIPAAKLMGGQNLVALAATLVESLADSTTVAPKRSEPIEPAALVEKLSDAEVEAMLREHANEAGEILARAEFERQ
jgi:acyl transferase domain-containing protein/acyl carrier protein